MKPLAAILGVLLLLSLGTVAGAQVASLSVSIAPPPPAASSGQDIRVDINIRNASARPIQFAASNWEGQAEISYGIRVTRKDRQPVALTEYGRSLAGIGGNPVGFSKRLRTLEPQQSVSEYFVLNRIYDVSKPGVYFVQVERQPIAGTATPLRSNTIEVLVR